MPEYARNNEGPPQEDPVNPCADSGSKSAGNAPEDSVEARVEPAHIAEEGPPQALQRTKLPPLDIAVGREYLGSSPRRHAWSQANGVCKSSASHPTRLAIRRRDLSAKLEQLLAKPKSRSSTADPSVGSKMDFNNGFNTGNAGMGFNPLMNMMFMPNTLGEMPPTPYTSGGVAYETGNLKFEVQALKNSTDLHNREILRHSTSIAELVKMNVDMLRSMRALEGRVQRQEVIIERIQAVAEQDDLIRRALSQNGIEVPGREHRRSPTPNFSEDGLTFGSEEEGILNHDQYVRDYTPVENNVLLRSVHTPPPHSPAGPSGSSQNTPNNKAATGSPSKTPNSKYGKNGVKPGHGMLQKRKVHNGTSMLPPPMTFVPRVPLTDKEIVVYFFNSLSRPIVSIRLYARGWGPSKIVETLNAHRDIEPPYLRNTCSVKCTTAQKRGVEKWGAEWDTSRREMFSNMDDVEATRLMYIGEDECEEPVDIDVLELLKGLKKHAELDVESEYPQYGIFTRCVMWCEENQRSCLMSNIHEVAKALEEGNTHLLGKELSVRQANEEAPYMSSGDQRQTRLNEIADDHEPMFTQATHDDGGDDQETALFEHS
ncbi:uncharacterized protein EI97DRAFT_172701 [Westerdykella ornata]|uniref:Uncharacterized protein n=1 Tax=Westerdykella ornata TaxID=318751 RepID=A0A6A6JW90_WESOR|nr:uncharacterized protein EI97DRAFT_172701 [Westerdykella ornata]KAF2279329.1 hypothetical protein EI97DRAFT_172701 [Westerdykella ornata]